MQDLSFPTRFVSQREEHYQLLWNLREKCLADDTARNALYQEIISALNLERKYVILLGYDVYDVPFKNKKGDSDNEAGAEAFKYIVCAVCPVKDTKANLHYVHSEATFHDGGMMQAISNPEIGFMYPSFNGRSTDIYSALYYSKNTKNNYPEFIDGVFGIATPIAADVQVQMFQSALKSGLGTECNIEVVQGFHQQVRNRLLLHKESKIPEPLTLNASEICAILSSCGVPDDKLESFEKEFNNAFGSGSHVLADNLIDVKHCDILTENVAIRMQPDAVGSVEIRKIGGVEYILIPAAEYVEVNGVIVSQN